MGDQANELKARLLARECEIERLRFELRWIADTPMQWNKPQNDVYWSNVAVAMAKKASDALKEKEDART